MPNAPKSPLIIGLTGGIGSGKTAVSDHFATLGIDVIDADVISHAITAKGSPVLDTLAQAFGADIITNGVLDRNGLRTMVFADPVKLATLNAITHPAIRTQIKHELDHATSAYAILSAPLLLESIKGDDKGLTAFCDRILVVDVPPDVQIERASRRDGQTADSIRAIMAKQIDRPSRLTLADDVVDNSGNLGELYAQLDTLHAFYLRLSGQP
ncbi:MAG: dephospho-CoA kinase [Moraxella sp.]|nr:dephospho-CoA kinase [Moraxella sp.]